jgi:outer membrane lipase/esterase
MITCCTLLLMLYSASDTQGKQQRREKMNKKFFMSTTLGVLFTSAACVFAPHVMADDVGDSIANLGGSNEFLINAGDAIRVTCRGLNSLGTGRTVDQSVLFGACGDMVNQAFFLDPANTGGTDSYGLGATASQEYFGLLRQFSGEETSSQGRYSTEGVNGQFKGIASRLTAIRSGARTSGLAMNLQGIDLLAVRSSSETGPATALVGGAAGEADADSGLAWFSTVDYGFGDRDATDFENGYDADSYGVTVGLDYAFGNGVTLGGAVSYHEHEVDFDSERSGTLNSVSGGSIDQETTTVAAFVNYAAERFYASAIMSVGQGEYDMDRSIQVLSSLALPAFNTELSSDTDSDQFAAQVQLGYTFGEGSTTFDVYGGFDLLSIEIDAYTETGSPLALQFGDQDIDSEQFFLGGTVRGAFNTGSGVLVPYATAEYRHETDNDARAVDARYALGVAGFTNANGETDNFALPTDDPDEDYFEVTLGLSGQLANSIALFVQYSAVVGLEDTSANLITMGVRGTF